MTARKHDHLEPEHLVEFERESLNDLAHAGARAHLEVCGRCRAELELLRQYLSIEEEAQLEDGSSPQLRASFRERLRMQSSDPATASRSRRTRSARPAIPRRGFWGILVAASLALIVVAGSQLWDGFRFSPDELELRAGNPAQWSAGLELQVLHDAALELDWPEWPGAQSYRVVLLDTRGATVYVTENSGPPLKIESSTLKQLQSGELHFAVVEVTRRSGEVLRSTPRAIPME